MKKLHFIALNSKYVHTNIALRYIKAYVEKYAVSKNKILLSEFTINNTLDQILEKLYMTQADYIVFSVYIWNVEIVLKLIKELKKVGKKSKIVFGGPEVSYNSEELMKKYPEIDYIISGEGEKIFLNFVDEDNIESVKGIYYRKDEQVKANPCEDPIENLDTIPFPYSREDFGKSRIVYYESSRGCPFSCSYCMSSIDKRVRYFSMERTKQDLKYFVDNGIKLVKFVDRTYNLDKKRYLEIWEYLQDIYTGKTRFHFEISGDLFDDDVLDFLETVPNDYFQFEIGVQTANELTLESINRKSNLSKLAKNIKRINDNIHLHLDLIVGLPYEDYKSFQRSFDFVYSLKPEMLQMGFLKILHGTQIEQELEKYEYKFRDYTPYEVLENKFIKFSEVLKLKNIEKILDFYYNSGKFEKSINYITEKKYEGNYFEFYEEFTEYWQEKEYIDVGQKLISQYKYLYDFYLQKGFEDWKKFAEVLKYDYLKLGKPGTFPKWYRRDTDKERYEILLQDIEFSSKREAYKNTEYEKFDFDVENNKDRMVEVLFNYKTKQTLVKEVT